MRDLYIFIFLTFSLANYGQIPNSNFEQWDSINGHEQPIDWVSNNQSYRNILCVWKNSESRTGNFAVSIASNFATNEGLGPGRLATYLLPPQNSDTLIAWVRCDSLEAPGFGFLELIGYHKNGTNNRIDSVFIRSTSTQYLPYQLAILSPQNYDSLKLVLWGMSVPTGVDYTGYAKITVDDLYFKSTLNSESSAGILKERIHIFPNPIDRYLQITLPPSEMTEAELRVCNINGRTVYSDRISSSALIDLSKLSSGIYLLWISTSEGVQNLKLVKN